MKFLLALIAVVVTVEARSFFPQEDLNKPGYGFVDNREKVNDFLNEIIPSTNNKDDFTTKKDYYKYFFPTKTDTYYPKYPTNPFYDPKGSYDFDSFTRYFTSEKVLSTIAKYFPNTKPTGDDTTNYYPVPTEIVDFVKGYKDLKEVIRTLTKYYYNLPEDVKAIVSQKYDFENVVRFLFQVYYDVPNVPYSLYTYFNLPTTVVTKLRTEFDIKKFVYTAFEKFSEFTPFEREFYTTKFYDVPSVVNTLVKVYYGVPQFQPFADREVEEYYYATPKSFVEQVFGSRFDFDGFIGEIFGVRSKLSEADKAFFDRFFNFDGFVKFIVKTYYYGVFEYSYGSTYYTKQTFYNFFGKIYDYYYSYYNTNDYPYNYNYYPYSNGGDFSRFNPFSSYKKSGYDSKDFYDFFYKFFGSYFNGQDPYYYNYPGKYYGGDDSYNYPSYPYYNYPAYPYYNYPKYPGFYPEKSYDYPQYPGKTTGFDFDYFKSRFGYPTNNYYPTYEKTGYNYDKFTPESFFEKFFSGFSKGKKF